MASRFARAAARANRVMMDRLSDGLCTFYPAQGEPVPDVPYQLDLSFETIDQNGLSAWVTALTVPKTRVARADFKDAFQVGERRWHFNGLLKDDGAFITVEVT